MVPDIRIHVAAIIRLILILNSNTGLLNPTSDVLRRRNVFGCRGLGDTDICTSDRGKLQEVFEGKGTDFNHRADDRRQTQMNTDQGIDGFGRFI